VIVRWRVFVGLWGDPEAVTHLDQEWFSYSAARAVLTERLERWANDSCEACVAAAAGDLRWLADLPYHGEFVGQVEGDDYLLIRSDRRSIDDLWGVRRSLT
jgi:hypothetical protein